MSPGAVVTYRLEATSPSSPKLQLSYVSWWCHYDPSASTWLWNNSEDGAINTLEWKHAKWLYTGRHRIICRTRQDSKWVCYEYEQIIAPIEGLIHYGRSIPQFKDDPVTVSNAVFDYVEMLHSIAKQYPITDEKQKKQFDKKMRQMEEYRSNMGTLLTQSEPCRRYRMDGELFVSETQERVELRAFFFSLSGVWTLIDWTNPVHEVTRGTFPIVHWKDPKDVSAKRRATDLDGINAAIADWKERNRYPPGMITYRVSGIPGVPDLENKFTTNGLSFWDEVSEVLTWISLGAAVVAGIIIFIEPVPGGQIASFAVWSYVFSAAAGMASAGVNIYQRQLEGVASWRADAFDVLSIAGNLFGMGAAGALWKRGAEVTVDAAGKGAIKTLLIGQVTADGAQGILLGVDFIGQFQDAMSNPSLTPEQRAQKVMQLLSQAIGAGVLFYFNFKGTKGDLENLNSRPHGEGELTPAEKLKQLADEHAPPIDTTKKPKIEGHTEDGPHKTKVQAEHETQPLSVRRPKKTIWSFVRRNKGPQKTANLKTLYRDAAVAKEELDPIIRELATSGHGEAVIADLKSHGSVHEKLAEYDGDASQLKDIARGMVVFDNMKFVDEAFGEVMRRYKIVGKPKNFFEKPQKSGYRDYTFNLEMSNGHVVELKLTLKSIKEVSDGVGHALYEQRRSITRRAQAEGRPLTVQEAAERDRILAQERPLYEEAMKKQKW